MCTKGKLYENRQNSRVKNCLSTLVSNEVTDVNTHSDINYDETPIHDDINYDKTLIKLWGQECETNNDETIKKSCNQVSCVSVNNNESSEKRSESEVESVIKVVM